MLCFFYIPIDLNTNSDWQCKDPDRILDKKTQKTEAQTDPDPTIQKNGIRIHALQITGSEKQNSGSGTAILTRAN